MSAPADPQLAARMDAVIDAAIAARRLVGVVVMVVEDGVAAYARAAGVADREAGRPMTTDTIFRLSSLTKPIVSAAALALVEQGRLSLDDALSRWIPEFTPRLSDGSAPEITVRHLLTHTSGLTYDFFEAPDGPFHAAGASSGLDQPGLSMAENLERLSRVPLLFPPGAAWNYSVSTDVLGEVLARAAGATLPEVVAQTVTQPLGMTDTGFTVADLSRLAGAYADAQPEPVLMGETHEVPFALSPIRYAPRRILDPASFPSGGAGMAGTPDDFIRFLEAVRQGGAPVLSKGSSARLFENAIGDIPLVTHGPGYGFSLGGAVLTDPEAAQSPQGRGTWSWGGVYGHSWFVDPQNRRSVLVMSNTAIEGMAGAFVGEVRAAIYGR